MRQPYLRSCVAILSPDRSAILMVRHRESDRDYWTLPGGGLEPGESAEAAAVREVQEETGLEVRILRHLFDEEEVAPAGETLVSRCFEGEVAPCSAASLGGDPEEAGRPQSERMLQAVAWRPVVEVGNDRQLARVLQSLAPAADLDPAIEAEIDDVLAQLNLVQKVSFLSGRDFWRTATIPELGIEGVTLTDGPHGVRIGNELPGGKNEGTATAFPTGTALASTWDTRLIRRVGVALAEEARAAGCDVLLGPCVNLIRVPVAGRNFETYSEDPLLAGKIGVAYVQGLQSRGIGASLKHFACNNQEYERTRGSSEVGIRALRELYLAQFEMIVREANPWTVMCSYNRINGVHASQHTWLLTEVLKKEWGYTGVVVSDWNANHEVYQSVAAGLDLEMPGPAVYFGKFLEAAVKSWQIDLSTIEASVRRLVRLEKRVKAYSLRNPEDKGVFSNDAHTQLAREVSAGSIVLLKNENQTLPLGSSSLKRVAVIGPVAAQASYGGGGSSIVPCAYTVSPLDGLREALGDDTEVVFAQGCEDRVKADQFSKVGLRVSNRGVAGFLQETWTNRSHTGEPLLVESVAELDFWQIFVHDTRVSPRNFSLRWSGDLIAERTGQYRFKFSYQGVFRFSIDGNVLAEDGAWHDREPYPFYTIQKTEPVRLEAGRTYRIVVDLINTLESERNALILKAQYLIPKEEVDRGIDQALELVRTCDRTVVIAGHSAGYEQEGIDRDDLVLPGAQNRLIEAILEVDPTAVVVLNTGAAVEMPWVDRARAILQAHFFGQEGGRALADVLLGKINPSGRLTMTYPIRNSDNPTAGTYPGGKTVHYSEGVFMGYRYYDHRGIPVLFPFGHGLSYTSFRYDGLRLVGSLSAGTLVAEVRVANGGDRPGAEIVQLYVEDFESSEPRPPRELKAFEKVFLKPGEETLVQFALDVRAFAFFSEGSCRWVAEAGEFGIAVGASSQDLRVRTTHRLEASLYP